MKKEYKLENGQIIEFTKDGVLLKGIPSRYEETLTLLEPIMRLLFQNHLAIGEAIMLST